MRRLAILLVVLIGWVPCAWCAPAAWDTTFGAPGVVYTTSGGIANRQVEGAGFRFMLAIDRNADRMYSRRPGNDGAWRGAAGSRNRDITSVTGRDISSWSATAITVAVWIANSSSIKIHTGTTIQGEIPAGYQTLAAACGATVAFTATGLGSNVTLSDSNMVMTTGSGTSNNGAKVDCTLAANGTEKIVFEVEVPSYGGTWGSNIQVGFVNSSWTGSSNLANSADAEGYWSDSCCAAGWFKNGTGDQTVSNIDSGATTAQTFHRGVRATSSAASGELKVWEITVDTATGGFTMGVADSVFRALDSDAGGSAFVGGSVNNGTTAGTHSFGFTEGGVCYDNNSTTSCTNAAPNTGTVVMFVLNNSTRKLWWGHNASGSFTWYGGPSCSPNPATATCGFDISGLSAGALWPAVSLRASTGNKGGQLTINGGATAFTWAAQIPSGYTALDPPSAVPRSRARIIGANDNFPACRADPAVLAQLRRAA